MLVCASKSLVHCPFFARFLYSVISHFTYVLAYTRIVVSISGPMEVERLSGTMTPASHWNALNCLHVLLRFAPALNCQRHCFHPRHAAPCFFVAECQAVDVMEMDCLA